MFVIGCEAIAHFWEMVISFLHHAREYEVHFGQVHGTDNNPGCWLELYEAQHSCSLLLMLL